MDNSKQGNMPELANKTGMGGMGDQAMSPMSGMQGMMNNSMGGMNGNMGGGGMNGMNMMNGGMMNPGMNSMMHGMNNGMGNMQGMSGFSQNQVNVRPVPGGCYSTRYLIKIYDVGLAVVLVNDKLSSKILRALNSFLKFSEVEQELT